MKQAEVIRRFREWRDRVEGTWVLNCPEAEVAELWARMLDVPVEKSDPVVWRHAVTFNRPISSEDGSFAAELLREWGDARGLTWYNVGHGQILRGGVITDTWDFDRFAGYAMEFVAAVEGAPYPTARETRLKATPYVNGSMVLRGHEELYTHAS